jgi:hypothetical protein
MANDEMVRKRRPEFYVEISPNLQQAANNGVIKLSSKVIVPHNRECPW